ncbi:MAG: PQQ-binding-like beta-propeller repeat protein [Caulobacteraceae bacterium]
MPWQFQGGRSKPYARQEYGEDRGCRHFRAGRCLTLRSWPSCSPGRLWPGAQTPSKTAAAPVPPAGPAPASTDWRAYAGNVASTRYAPLDQINASNFNDLEVAWRFRPDAFGARPEFNLEGTPLVIKGVLYCTVGTRRDVVALDAATGELLWMHRIDEGARADKAPRKLSGHGVSYWSDGKEERILYVTVGYQLVALDAKTGLQIPSFGDNGIVDLKLNDDQEIGPLNDDIGLHSTPCVAKDVVIVGAAHTVGTSPKHHANVKGYARGFDVRTGKRLWIFHTIPQKGEFGYDTWLDGTDQVGNTGVWPRSRPTKSWSWSICRSSCPPAISTATTAAARACSARASWRSICIPACAAGTSRPCTTACGTTTSPPRRSCATSPSAARSSRLWPSRPSSRSSMYWTAPTASRSGRSSKRRSLRATCPANGTRRPSRSPPSLRPTTSRA